MDLAPTALQFRAPTLRASSILKADPKLNWAKNKPPGIKKLVMSFKGDVCFVRTGVY